ncbi:D-Ala-D-Ala carboxypeptidase family metallohydrolase [Photobacterium sagamiensis]|uniref:D-Ala-D-Ala carboxypeptidase family metallohydrolase n=1 Tax=Photobacterium sagamiensis TaxID=2910241 RepID=UPI003D0A87A1
MQVPHGLQKDALDALQRVRDRFFALTERGISLNSAYRCAEHPDEVEKEEPGYHHKGTAFDIRVGWVRDPSCSSPF